METCTRKYLLIEPFYGGSHKKMIDIICTRLPANSYKLVTMEAKKWHWRARTSALYVSTKIPTDHNFTVLFCTSVLPLAELLGLRPDLHPLKKVVYFHENQLEFPVQDPKLRDFQYGFNEILSCLAADKVVFNSEYNASTFLRLIRKHLRMQPDYKFDPNYIPTKIMPKIEVLYYPIELKVIDKYITLVNKKEDDDLVILWPHRWEFDKKPEDFVTALCRLQEEGYRFKVNILGESFSEKPEAFESLSNLQSKILHCGFVDNQQQYYQILSRCDVVVSTAIHEFFGVAVLEAVYCGCVPVVPYRLSYVELFADDVTEMYSTLEEFYQVLAHLCEVKLQGGLNKHYGYLVNRFDADSWFEKFARRLGFEASL